MLRFTRDLVAAVNAPCRDHAPMMSAELDNRLPRGARIGLRIHTIVCGPCRRLRRQLRFLHAAAPHLAADAADRALAAARMPDDVRARLSRRLAPDENSGL